MDASRSPFFGGDRDIQHNLIRNLPTTNTHACLLYNAHRSSAFFSIAKAHRKDSSSIVIQVLARYNLILYILVRL